MVLLVLIDQMSKLYVSGTYELGERTEVIPDFFYIQYVRNAGAAWSFLSGKEWAQTFFVILTSVSLVIFLFFFIWAARREKRFLQFIIMFIIGGAIGNFIDRIAYGNVVDFLSFYFGKYRFPVFNIADSVMFIGILLVIIYMLFIDEGAVFKKKKKDEKS